MPCMDAQGSVVVDAGALANFHELDLTGCLDITDFTALGIVLTLLLHTTAVLDVIALSGVHAGHSRLCSHFPFIWLPSQ